LNKKTDVVINNLIILLYLELKAKVFISMAVLSTSTKVDAHFASILGDMAVPSDMGYLRGVMPLIRADLQYGLLGSSHQLLGSVVKTFFEHIPDTGREYDSDTDLSRFGCVRPPSCEIGVSTSPTSEESDDPEWVRICGGSSEEVEEDVVLVIVEDYACHQ
jgi:hypothetical protein